MSRIRVTLWNEFVHEREQNPVGAYIRTFYPDGIHGHLQKALAADDLELQTAVLDAPGQVLDEDLLNRTDVLVWWGHCAHDRVPDELVDRIQLRIQAGMGLIVLHSGHYSKVFRRMMGTSCRLRWREVGEKERLWVVAPGHPIARGIPPTFTLPHSEMYGENFDVPDDGKIVFMSWFEGGNVFRSGITFFRDAGKIFYFSPGHEAYPIYQDANILRILANAIRWAAPGEIQPPRVTPSPESVEPIATVNPLSGLDTRLLHYPDKEKS